MKHSEEDFWKSSLKKIGYLCEQFANELSAGIGEAPQTVPEISSMKEIAGWC